MLNHSALNHGTPNREIYKQESDFGNNEYKLKIDTKSDDRIEQLISQMRFRLTEGSGETIYTLGVADDGTKVGLTLDEYHNTLKLFELICVRNKYIFTPIYEEEISPFKKIYEFLIREDNNEYIDLKVAVAGNVDSGKTSTIGTLIMNKLDDGRGLSRQSVFNYPHEIKTGRTSSVAHHILGFNKHGDIVNTDKSLWSEIVKDSIKIVTFFDLCGHEKYLKTTIHGLSAMFPDMCLITVGSNMGMNQMTKEHIYLCMALQIPFLILVTKIDICKNKENVLGDTISDINNFIKTKLKRTPYTIKNSSDVVTIVKKFQHRLIVPIIHTSNVTGEGLDMLKSFLNLYNTQYKKQNIENVEMYIDTTFQVPGVGVVVGGQLISGIIKVGDKLFLGPNQEKYEPVHVRSIHMKRINVSSVKAGSYVCLCLKKIDKKSIFRGNILLSNVNQQLSVYNFSANITVMTSHSTTIKKGYCPLVHAYTIRQCAEIVDITNKVCYRNTNNEDQILRAGDKATVHFRFVYKSEYIKPGMKIVLAEGQIKIIGTVISIN